MINACGRSVTEIRVYLNDPKIELDVKCFNVHRVTLVGKFDGPGSTIVKNVPLRLLGLITQAGTTDLRRIEVHR
jgi:hypothetical protein